MVVFRHPDGRTSRLDRYNWIISRGPESRSVTSRLDTRSVLDGSSTPEHHAPLRPLDAGLAARIRSEARPEPMRRRLDR